MDAFLTRQSIRERARADREANELPGPKKPVEHVYDAAGIGRAEISDVRPCRKHPDAGCVQLELRWPDPAWTWACETWLEPGPNGCRKLKAMEERG